MDRYTLLKYVFMVIYTTALEAARTKAGQLKRILMNDEINYKNNPLNGVGLKKMLTELTEHYGFDILVAYLSINCFRNNPSVASSVKFLKKTDWAREKVEAFYLYSFKNLPKASYDQSRLPPRDRIVPDDQTPGEPAVLTIEDAEQLREMSEKKAAEYDLKSGSGGGTYRNATKNSPSNNSERSDGTENTSASEDSRQSPESKDRVASTADNPWGIPRG